MTSLQKSQLPSVIVYGGPLLVSGEARDSRSLQLDAIRLNRFLLKDLRSRAREIDRAPSASRTRRRDDHDRPTQQRDGLLSALASGVLIRDHNRAGPSATVPLTQEELFQNGGRVRNGGVRAAPTSGRAHRATRTPSSWMIAARLSPIRLSRVLVDDHTLARAGPPERASLSSGNQRPEGPARLPRCPSSACLSATCMPTWTYAP